MSLHELHRGQDLGIPSDCNPMGTDMGTHLIEPYEAESFDHLYQPSRYDGTICEPGPTHHQQKMARVRHNIVRAIVVALGVIGASFLVMTAIQQFGAQRDHEVVAQVQGFEGGQ